MPLDIVVYLGYAPSTDYLKEIFVYLEFTSMEKLLRGSKTGFP